MGAMLDWNESPDPRPLIDEVVRHLSQGRSIALPTESTYVRVIASSSDEPSGWLLPPGTALADGQLGDSRVARRLAKRCWPGPLQIEISGHPPLWEPEHPVACQVLAATGPVRFTGPSEPCRTVEQAA